MPANIYPYGHLIFLLATTFLLVCLTPHDVIAQVKPVDYRVHTLFGGLNGDGLNATMVGINYPQNVAVSSTNGYVYYTDNTNHQVRCVKPDGTSFIVAGNPCYNYDSVNFPKGQTPTNTSIYYPYGITVNSKGDVYFTDSFTVRKVSANGSYMMIVAGGGSDAIAQNVSALTAKLYMPRGVVVDDNDVVYVCDSYQFKIRKIENGTIYTIAGTGVSGASSPDGTLAINANIGTVNAMAFHPITRELYYIESTNVRYIASNGTIYTYYSGTVFSGMVFSSNGDLYLTESGYSRIVKIVRGSRIVVANNPGLSSFSGDGGLATTASLSSPTGLAILGSNLFVADTVNFRIRKISLDSNIITTIAGDGSKRYMGSNVGNSTNMVLDQPTGTYYNSHTDELFIVDKGNNRVLRLQSLSNYNTSNIDTILGTGASSDSPDGNFGNQTAVLLPHSITQSESTGDIYVGSTNLVLKLRKSDQKVSTIAGTRSTLSGDGYQSILSQLSIPKGLCLSSTGEIFFTDSYNYVVRKIDNLGIITTIIGDGVSGYRDGNATSSRLALPSGITCLPNGDLLIADTYGSQRIRKYIASTKKVTTVAGNGNFGFGGDGGLATLASLYEPNGIYYNSTNGDIIFADTANSRIRKISNSTGIITTIAGTGSNAYNGEGLDSLLSNISPTGIAVHPITKELYFSDLNYMIRRIANNGSIYTVIGGAPKCTTFTTRSLANETCLYSVALIDFSPNGDLYMAVASHNVIKKMDYGTDIVYNIAGFGPNSYFTGDLNATSTTLWNPFGVAYNSFANELIFCDSSFNRVRKITKDGFVKTIAGGIGESGLAVNAKVGSVFALALTANEIYLSDSVNYRIRKVSFSTGIINTVVGTFGYVDAGDNLYANQTTIFSTNDLKLQNNELIYINSYNCKLMKTDPSGQGIVKKIAGTYCSVSTQDNIVVSSANFLNPMSFSFLPSGELLIADSDNNLIKKLDSNGYVSIIAGTAGKNGFNGDGIDAKKVLLNKPAGLSVLKDGRIIFSDNYNNRIRVLTPYCKENYSLTQSSQGLVCNITSCFGILYNSTTVCSGNGMCQSTDSCVCTAGYSGAYCSVPDICSVATNSLICSSSLQNTTETQISKVSNITQLDSKTIQFSTTTTVTISLPPTISQYLESIDSSLKNDSVSVVSSVSKTVEKSEVVSSIISIIFLKTSTSSKIPVENLQQPISLYFNNVNVTLPNVESLNITCMYFDETEKQWKSDGIITKVTQMDLHNLDDGNTTITISLTCTTNHLTSFSVIDQNYKKVNSDSKDVITLNDYTVIIAAVVGSVGGCCVLATVLAIIIAVICLLRKKNRNK